MPQSLWPRWRVSACGTSRSRTPVSGSTLVAAQRVMRLTTFSRARRPIPSSLPMRSSSHQAGQLETYRFPRKRSGLTGAPTMSSTVATEARLMIDTTLRARSEKLMAVSMQDSWRPPQLAGAIIGEKAFDHGATFGSAQVGADFLLRRDGFDCQRVGRLIERRAEAGEPRVLH